MGMGGCWEDVGWIGGGLEEDWRRTGGGLQEHWRSLRGGCTPEVWPGYAPVWGLDRDLLKKRYFLPKMRQNSVLVLIFP